MSLKLFVANDDYVNYLQTFDKNVKDNKKDGQPRPYVGIVIDINKLNYYIPLCSAKHPKHDGMSDSLDFIRIDFNGKLVSILNISSMIPIPDSEINPMDLNFRGESYKGLVSNEIRVIRKKKDIIIDNANKLYNKMTKFRTEPKNASLADRCCNYSLLEEKMNEYIIEKEAMDAKCEAATSEEIQNQQLKK